MSIPHEALVMTPTAGVLITKKGSVEITGRPSSSEVDHAGSSGLRLTPAVPKRNMF